MVHHKAGVLVVSLSFFVFPSDGLMGLLFSLTKWRFYEWIIPNNRIRFVNNERVFRQSIRARAVTLAGSGLYKSMKGGDYYGRIATDGAFHCTREGNYGDVVVPLPSLDCPMGAIFFLMV